MKKQNKKNIQLATPLNEETNLPHLFATLVMLLALALIVGATVSNRNTVPEEYNLTISHYVGEYGVEGELVDTQTFVVPVGSPYTVETPVRDGYVADTVVVTGVKNAFREIREIHYFPIDEEATTSVKRCVWDGEKFVYLDTIEETTLNGESVTITLDDIDGMKPDRGEIVRDVVTGDATYSVFYAPEGAEIPDEAKRPDRVIYDTETGSTSASILGGSNHV